MELLLTEQFEDSYDRLSGEDKEKVQKTLLELEENPHLPGLRVKKMADKRDIWEARASRKLRLTFKMEGGSLTLRHVGQHDKVLDKP
jgi:mRNA interferase RelE/StbE